MFSFVVRPNYLQKLSISNNAGNFVGEKSLKREGTSFIECKLSFNSNVLPHASCLLYQALPNSIGKSVMVIA